MKLKKILIGGILLFTFVMTWHLNLVFKNRYNLGIAYDFDNKEISNEKEHEIFSENIVSEDKIVEIESTENVEQPIMEEKSENPSTIVNTQEVVQEKTSSTIQSQKTSNTLQAQASKTEKTMQSKSVENTIQSQSKQTENKSQSQEQEQTQTQTQTPIQVKTEITIPETTTTQEPQKVTEGKTESTIPTSPSIPVVTQPEEKYVRNDEMINRIKSVIENNPSEYMQTHNYEIIVDSSIKEHSNPFTFTETRVKAYITYSFGTIKIYAEDYYRNGQLIMTECYLF